MARTKGSKNKKPTFDPLQTIMTTEERIEFMANLIVEQIERFEDMSKSKKQVEEDHGGTIT